VLLLTMATGSRAQTQARPAPSWQEVKCTRYAEAWSEATVRLGRQGLGEEFVSRHAAFIASGCRRGRDVCPRSEAELAMADLMTVAAMNGGMASSFPPFACRG
jgi:hypothetical protein